MSSLQVRTWITPAHHIWHGFASATLLPLQGFWNMLVFKYPGYLAWRDQNKRALRESSEEGNSSNERSFSSILRMLSFRRVWFEENAAREVEGMDDVEECQENNDMLGSTGANASEPNARETE
jgi:hypothetical protein